MGSLGRGPPWAVVLLNSSADSVLVSITCATPEAFVAVTLDNSIPSRFSASPIPTPTQLSLSTGLVTLKALAYVFFFFALSRLGS